MNRGPDRVGWVWRHPTLSDLTCSIGIDPSSGAGTERRYLWGTWWMPIGPVVSVTYAP